MKGLVIANCGALGLDWERLSMSGYLEAMAARSGGQDSGAPEISPALRRFMAAHQGEA